MGNSIQEGGSWVRENGRLLHHTDPAAVRHEAEVAASLRGEGALTFLGLEETAAGPVAVYADPGATTLEALEAERALTLTEAVALSIAVVRSLSAIHAEGIVHGQVHPGNLFVSEDRGRVWLAGFDQSSRLDEHTRELEAPERLPYRLGWLSPEQTGRMNRSVGYRADYYALGVTLFQLFTGRMPLSAGDALGWVHAHIAQRPLRADEVDALVPAALADVLDRLLEKNAEARYQSTRGILADLERCARGLAAGDLQRFPLGAEDHSERFTLPERLYGREAELRTLMRAFERAADEGPAGLVLVSGWSGIGKSALLYEVHRPLAERFGSFLSGKSEPHTRSIPYHSLLQAFQGYCVRMLTWSDSRIAAARRVLKGAVHPNGRVLTEVLPELELVLGPQPAVPELPTVEARNRFNHTFLRFAQALASPEHPLLLFLDDLQWIDASSLELIGQLLQSDQTRNLLLLGAYRSNEVDDTHPLALALPRWEDAGVPIQSIPLAPLERPALRSWLADVTGTDGQSLEGLTSMILEKTGANPFFVRAFLKELHTLELLRYDRPAGHWRWDLEELRSRGFTDNVVEHMAGRIGRLPPLTQRALSMAAAVGARFDLAGLAEAAGEAVTPLAEAIWLAAEAGLVLPEGDARGVRSSVDATERGEAVSFRFVHDRVQEAAYQGIPEADRPAVHLALGRQLRASAGGTFTVMSHYLRGLPLLTDSAERLEVAGLLRDAASLATRSGAHDAALRYLEAGASLVGDARWESHYDLSLGIYTALAHADYLSGNIQRAEANSERVLARARNVNDRLPILEARVLHASAEMKLLECVAFTIETVRDFGLEVPLLTSPEELGAGMAAINEAMAGRSFLELADAPVNDDPSERRIVTLLNASLPAAAMARPEAYAGLLFTALRYTLERGITPDSPGLISSYGLFLQMAGLPDLAYQTGAAAAAVRQRFGFGAGGWIEFGVFVQPWTDPLADCQALLREGAHRCLEAGHQTNWGYCLNQSLKFAYLSGASLAEADASYERDWRDLTQRQQLNSRGSLELWGQAIACLRGEAPDPSRLCGERFDADADLDFFVEARIGTMLQYTLSTQCTLAYLFGDYERALERGWAHDELAGAGANSVAQTEVERVCYRTLAALALPDPDMERVRADRTRVAAWAARNPANFATRLALIDAEIARAEGRQVDALNDYERAASLATEHALPQHGALANERAALFHLAEGREGVGHVYLERAAAGWQRWGATALVDAIQSRFGLSLTVRSEGADLDVGTVLKAAATITSEIVLDKLLVRMMALLVENAGATRGALVLRRRGRLELCALQEGASTTARVYDGLPLFEQRELPSEILRYAARTGKTVLLSDATHDPIYGDAPTIRERGTRSVLCVPLFRQGKLTGLLYLDNDLAADAFTPERVALLEALSGQVAIATENANLYADLEEQARSFARFVPRQFLSNLGRDSIRDVQLGDAVRREMGVLFSDIRGFTTLSESMSPEENFRFLNGYLQQVGPVIRSHDGFVDKFIGDAVMALFPGSADSLVAAAVGMQRAIRAFGERSGRDLRAGVGLHRGKLMLGVLGESERMDSTVISDAVNIGARLEQLCKTYSADVLASQQVLDACADPSAFPHRCLGDRRVRGKVKSVRIYEVFGHEDEDVIAAKLETRPAFEAAVSRLGTGDSAGAMALLQEVSVRLPEDRVTRQLLKWAGA